MFIFTKSWPTSNADMPFLFLATDLPEVVVITPRRFTDERGWFAETYKKSDFTSAGINESFVQDNHSMSALGTIRGLHYQLAPYGQGKLVSVAGGKAWDVAVDVRRSSPTFGNWVGVELSAENGRLLWIPPGFAHGFLALEEDTHLVYKCTAEYHSASERSVRWNDESLAIRWPESPAGGDYLLSDKDANAPLINEAEVYP